MTEANDLPGRPLVPTALRIAHVPHLSSGQMQAALELPDPRREVVVLLVELLELVLFLGRADVFRRLDRGRLLPGATDPGTDPEDEGEKERSFQWLAHGDHKNRTEATPEGSKERSANAVHENQPFSAQVLEEAVELVRAAFGGGEGHRARTVAVETREPVIGLENGTQIDGVAIGDPEATHGEASPEDDRGATHAGLPAPC